MAPSANNDDYMEEIKNADLNINPAPAAGEKKEEPPAPVVPPQEPLQIELDKIRARNEGHTQREKLIFSKKRIDQQLSELDGKEGIEPKIEEDDDNAPVTIGLLKKLEAQKTQKTALQMAESITDSVERELIKHHLQNTIRSTGNPDEDIRLAKAIVNSAKNAQIAIEINRRSNPSEYRGGPGAPINYEVPFEPTPEETYMMTMKGVDGKPLLSKEDILKSRKEHEAKLNRG
jgi:hypothetical protein